MSNFGDLVKKSKEYKEEVEEEKKKSYFGSLVEKAYSGNTYTRLNGTEVSTWGSSVSDAISRANTYLSTDKYRKADTSFLEEFDKYESDAADVLQYLRANKTKIEDYDKVYQSYFDLTDAIKKYRNAITATNEFYSQWESEEDYNKAVKKQEEAQKTHEGYMKFDLKAGWSEIESLEKELAELKIPENEARGIENAKKLISKLLQEQEMLGLLRAKGDKEAAEKYKTNEETINFYTEEIRKVESQYATQRANLTSLISQKKQYYTLAERAQKAVELASVADPTSKNYDVEFEKYAEQGNAFGEGEASGWNKLFGGAPENYIAHMRNNPKVLEAYEDSAEATRGAEDVLLNDITYKAAKYMTPDQFKLYNYYFAKDKENGTNLSNEYLDSIEETLNYQIGLEKFGDLEGNAFKEYLFGVEAGLDQFVTGIESLFSNEDYIPISATQYASGMVREDLAENGTKLPDWLGGKDGTTWGQVGYDAITTTSNMLPSVLVSFVPVVGQTASAVMLGASAAGNAKAEMLRLGYSKEQATTYGIMVGVTEVAMEKLLGSIPGISNGGGIFSTLSNKAISKIDNALARVSMTIGGNSKILEAIAKVGLKTAKGAINLVGGALDEALEEGLQTIIEPWLAEVATNVDWDDPTIDEVLYSSLLGAISSIGLGGGGNAVVSVANTVDNKIQYNQALMKHGQSIIDRGGEDLVMKLALEKYGNENGLTAARGVKLASDVATKATPKNVGKLSAQLESTITEQNRTDIENALAEKGLSKKDAKRVAEYLGSGKVLTAVQKAEVEGNENIKAVMDELLNDPKSSISERTRNLIAARLGMKINAESSGELSLRNDVDVKEKVSDTGKTTITETYENGKEVTKEITIDKKNPIAKVKYVDGERVVYYNTDQGVVEASNVKYASEEEGLLYEAFTDMNPAFANAVIKNYDGSVPIQTYINGMREGMILYGMHNFNAVGEDIANNTFLADLSEADQAFALKLGRAYAKADAKKAGKDLRTAIRNAAEKAETSKGASSSEATQNKPKKGTVRFEEGAKIETHKQHKRIISLAKHLAKAINIDIVFYDSRITGKKAGQGANGYFDADTDTIYLDLQNAQDDAKTIAYTLSHELVHFIKKWSPQKFNTFAEFLMEQYASHGVSAANLLKRKMVELNTTDADLAYEEMIADACETMLLDSNAMVKLMELRKTDLELFEKIKLHVLKILNDIREAYKKLGYEPSSDEAKALLGMKDVLEKFYSLFEEAAVDATKNYQALGTEGYNELVAKSTKNANKTVFGEVSVDVGKTESGVKHQLKAHKAIGEASITYNERHKNVHKAILQVGVESMYEMAEAMLPYLEEEGILPPDIPGKTIFKNGSYGKTGENTTLCVRTLTYEDFKDRVAEKIGRPLTVSESLLVSQKIYDIATEPQCIYCYVAADRKAYDENLGKYWNEMDKYIKAMREGGDSRALYTEYLAGRKDTGDQRKRWSQWEAIAKSGKEYISASDLTTKRKRDAIIAKKNAFSDQIKDAQRYAQNASWAKLVADYRAYKGDILKMTSKFVDMLNSEYGLRMYSFSDYTPAFIVENMQMIIDASVKGLKSLAYTKDTDYAEIFASTGQAINVSCFAKWDAEKGTYVEDNRQGANWEKTKNLRKQYRNVGAVMVATNDAMVEWALKQDWVDVVIPYHIVKTGTTIANEYQWNNYTSESSDRIGNKGANIYPTEHNNDFATYSDLLKERGITPRFSRWYDMVASGELTEEQYMKLVNEVRLPASELSPVVPSFNLEAAKRSFGIDNEGNVIKGGFVDKGGYMGGWYRQGVDVNQEVMAVSEDIKAGKSSLDVDYGMSKAGKERVEQRYKKQSKRNAYASGEYREPINIADVKALKAIAAKRGKISVKDLSNGEIEALQKWAYKYWSNPHTKTKSPFFRAWFGDWRESTKFDVDVVDTKSDNRKDVINEDTGWTIKASRQVHKETSNHKGSAEVNAVKFLPYIDDITKKAILFDSVLSDKDNENSIMFHTMYAYTEAMGYPALLKLKVEELFYFSNTESGVFQRDYILQNIEEESLSKRNRLSRPNHLKKDSSVISIADLYDIVKTYEKNFHPGEASKVVNTDGTPMSVYHGSSVKDIEEFNTTNANGTGGLYLSTNRKVAEGFAGEDGEVYESFVNLRTPFIVDANGAYYDSIAVPSEMKGSKYTFGGNTVDTNAIAAYARENNYDGVIIKNVREATGFGDDIIAFEPTQVKSATDNIGTFDGSNSNIHYQKKKVSNRTILANALDTTAQNDIERNKLTQYKEKITLIETEEAKLADLRAKIKELSFAKGARDTAAIKKLQFEANQTANRINTYDRQLLNLESTTALKGVLEREKQMAYKRAEQKGKDALDAYREKMTKTQRELLTRYQDSRKKGIEGRKMTEMRHKIKTIVSELDTLLRKPTAKKHIKEELRAEVADALLAINMDTVGADERVARYNEMIAKAKDPDIIAELTKTRDRIQLQGDNLKEKLANLHNAYEKIKASEDIELSMSYQEVIQNSIKNVADKIGNTSIRNMTLEQLEMVYDLFSMIRKTIRNANKAFNEQKGQTITQMAEAVNDQVRTVGGQPYKRNAVIAALQREGWSLLKPYVAFRTIGSVTLTNLYKELRNGEDTFYEDVKEAQAFIEEQYEKHNYKSWDMKKTNTFTAKSGKTFDLTLEQMMTLYAYSRREQAHKHIIEGGIVFEDSMIVEKNKWGVPIKYEVTTKDAFNLSEETFADIANSLTAEQKAFVDAMQEYLSKTMGGKGNDVSMELLSVKLFKEEFYLPIKSSQEYRSFSAEEAGEVKLRSPAFSKETVQHANNPIVLHNFTDLWAEHINDMSMYHSFVLALEDFTRVYNYKTRTDAKLETMSTKATLDTAFPGATKYINKFLKDMNGGVRSETVGWAEKLTSLAKKGAVLGSASVAIQQPSAVMRAMAMINPKHFVATTGKSFNLAKHKQDWAELKKYAPIAGIKEMGRFDVGMGKGTVELIKSNDTVLSKIDDVVGFAPEIMDEITWVSIWNAIKRETVHNRKDLRPGSDEFLKVAGERFTDVISLTQVYDSVFSRSDLMRNKSLVAKWLTAFMAEPTTTLNMLIDAYVQGKRTGSLKGFAKATAPVVSSVVAAIVFNALLKSIVMAARDDDEDESYAEKYLEHFVGDLKDNLNPLTLIPVVKDILSIFDGYDVERMDMSLVSDFKKAIEAFDSDNKTLYEKWSGLIGATSAFFGLPVKNVERDVRAVINTFFGKKESTTKQGLLDAISEGWTGESKSNGQQLYEAMASGDKEQIERVKGRFKDQNAINSAIRTALRENDARIKEAAVARYNGDIAEYMRIAKEIIAEGHFKQDDIVAAINNEINSLKKGEGTTESSAPSDKATSIYKVDDYYAALVGRDQATAYVVKEDLIKTEEANGKDRDEAEADFNGKFTSYLREKYEEGELSDYEAEDMLVNYAGKSEEDASSKVQYWNFKMEYPDYDLSESAVNKYYNEVEPSGIKIDVYYDYTKQRAKSKGVDKNGDGKADSGTVKREVLNVINSLPITNAQKDALYFAEGWAKSTLWEAPWH